TVGINTTRRGESLAADVRRADCQILLTDHRHLGLLGGLDLGGATVVDTDDVDWRERVAGAPRGTAGFPTVDAMDTFMLIFTSGTSGEPKAVRVANFMAAMSGATLADKFDLTTEDI
ncbi:AMP-binding protein, partial [Micromonospora aurantiaca]|nr:AMP-binding protein [Micromonospora aurantiaca]